jgi:hypothetical protein
VKKEQIRKVETKNGTIVLMVNGNEVASMVIGENKPLAEAFAAEFVANGYRGMMTMAAAKKAVR